jgi:Type II CAAX prenyl endopeptidase Rce1-like
VASAPRVWATPSTTGLLAGCPTACERLNVAAMTRTATPTGSVRTLVARHPVNLWEETAVMGVIQARLVATRGPIGAAAITGLVFGLYHLPLHLGQPVGDVVTTMAVIFVIAILLRFVAGWLYAGTGGSILLVAGLHATFNAVNGSALPAASALIVVAIWGLGLLVATRGRLGVSPA